MPVGARIPRPRHPSERRFFTLGADALRIRASAGSSRRPSQRVDVDHGQLVYPSPERCRGRKWACTISPQSVGGPRAGETGGALSGSRRWVRIFRIVPGSRTGSPQQPEVAKRAKARDGFALVKQSERDQPDVTAAGGARKWKLLPHPRHEFRPGLCATCHASGALGSRDSRRDSLLWRARRPYARPSRPLAACRHSRFASAVTARLSL